VRTSKGSSSGSRCGDTREPRAAGSASSRGGRSTAGAHWPSELDVPERLGDPSEGPIEPTLSMTNIRMIPAHEIVRRTYPRPPPEERDQIAMAIGKAIDTSLSQFGHEIRQGRRPTQTAIARQAASLLDEALEEAAVSLEAPAKADTMVELQQVLAAYRRSEIAGLARPRTRIFVIGTEVGVYAQPDYWDGRRRFFEMKSYRAIPPPPDVTLQLRLFQLAFPAFEAVLICLDRHARPVTTTSAIVPPPTSSETADTLRRALALGREFGQEKVLEYIEGPFVHYEVPSGASGDVPGPATGPLS